jgi:hypothetical protein
MKTLGLSALALLALVSGCSFAVRAPDNYRDDTQALLDTRSAQVKACYDDALKTSKDLSGRVTVHFTVEHETGKVINIAAVPAGTTAPDTLTKCVVDSLQGLALVPPDQKDGDASFVYDFSAGAPAPTPAPAG